MLDVAGAMEVRLCDLTGFEGRVDALAFVPDGERPVRPAPATEEGGAFDFVVVGGGFAGLCAAGKDISGTYAALSSYRVENTCAAMGGMVGRAAALRLELGVMPRTLGAEHLAELKAALSAGR